MMVHLFNRLRSDERGATLVEFAFASPVLIAGIVGIMQIGQLLQVRAEMHHALGEGARYLKVNTSASKEQVQTEVEASYNGIEKAKVKSIDVVPHTSSGVHYRTLTLTYEFDPEFVMFDVDPITLTATRTVYLQS